jgi:hypothetical protein
VDAGSFLKDIPAWWKIDINLGTLAIYLHEKPFFIIGIKALRIQINPN